MVLLGEAFTLPEVFMLFYEDGFPFSDMRDDFPVYKFPFMSSCAVFIPKFFPCFPVEPPA